jgi:hypothetical protein
MYRARVCAAAACRCFGSWRAPGAHVTDGGAGAVRRFSVRLRPSSLRPARGRIRQMAGRRRRSGGGGQTRRAALPWRWRRA